MRIQREQKGEVQNGIVQTEEELSGSGGEESAFVGSRDCWVSERGTEVLVASARVGKLMQILKQAGKL